MQATQHKTYTISYAKDTETTTHTASLIHPLVKKHETYMKASKLKRGEPLGTVSSCDLLLGALTGLCAQNLALIPYPHPLRHTVYKNCKPYSTILQTN